MDVATMDTNHPDLHIVVHHRECDLTATEQQQQQPENNTQATREQSRWCWVETAQNNDPHQQVIGQTKEGATI